EPTHIYQSGVIRGALKGSAPWITHPIAADLRMSETSENAQSYEELFAQRFSSEDSEYQQYLNRPADPPPIVEDWRGHYAYLSGTRTVVAIEGVAVEKTGDGEGTVVGSSSTGMTETGAGGMAVDISLDPEAPTRDTSIISDHIMIVTDCHRFVSINSSNCVMTQDVLPCHG
ncbi:hypothetical protein XENOCAPTIV_005207, partial [Xenoophorus captivus]